jgi:hypothetical protein
MSTILGKVQIGKETVRGTGVAATVMVPIVQKPLPVDRKVKAINFDTGMNVDVTHRSMQGRLVEDTLQWDDGYFQILPHLFSGLLKGGVTPVEQTADQDDWLWEHEPALDDTDNAQDSFTIERGDNIQAVEHNYSMFKRFKISGQINQEGGDSPVSIEVDYFARENVNSSFTAGLDPLEPIFLNAKLARVYLDALWADVGETELTGLLRSFELEILSGLHPTFNGGAVETFGAHEQGPMSAILNLTLVRGTTTEALRAAINEFRAARLTITGPKIGTGVNQLVSFDLGGYIEDVVAMAQNTNNKNANLDTVVLHGQYDATSGKLIVPSVITNVASI